MRTAKRLKALVVLAGFAALLTPGSYAQSEVDPDQFESPNTEPIPQPKPRDTGAAETAKVRFDGKVTLPYSLLCAGKRLIPGRYTVSVRSDGKTGRATLNQKGQAIEILGVVRQPADAHARNVLLVENIGRAHRLSSIHVKEMELVFGPDPQPGHAFLDKPKRIESLLLVQTSPRNN
jgi:hypothetical protein